MSAELVRITYGRVKGLPLAKLDRVELQYRPHEWVRVDDISLRPGKIPRASVTNGRLEDQPMPQRRIYGNHKWNDSLSSVFQCISFSGKAQIDVRWDKLEAVGVMKNTTVKMTA